MPELDLPKMIAGMMGSPDTPAIGWAIPAMGWEAVTAGRIDPAAATGWRARIVYRDPRSPQETDRPFAEPALFVINPDGNIQIVDISNVPLARPDLKSLLKGIQFVASKSYPIGGLA